MTGQPTSDVTAFSMPSPALIEGVASCIEEVLTFENFRGCDDEQLAYLLLRALDERGLAVTTRKGSER